MGHKGRPWASELDRIYGCLELDLKLWEGGGEDLGVFFCPSLLPLVSSVNSERQLLLANFIPVIPKRVKQASLSLRVVSIEYLKVWGDGGII